MPLLFISKTIGLCGSLEISYNAFDNTDFLF